MKRCEGPDCAIEFEPKRSTAKYCSATCRQRAGRARRAPAPAPADELEAPTDPQGLVASVRADLEAAGRVKTFAGQLALQLAARLTNPEESGISSLSKELRTVMAAALEGVTPPSAEATPDEASKAAAPDEQDDEVTRARRQREEARQAAGLA